MADPKKLSEEEARRKQADRARQEQERPDGVENGVDEAGAESFPSSDPPSYSGGTTTPKKKDGK